jgi:hypothetical protein
LVVNGLSQDARDVLDVVRGLDLGSEGTEVEIHRDQVNDVLGRPHGDPATQRALAELEVIGDLENATHLEHVVGPISFTLV